MIPQRSAKARKAKSVFFRYDNEIDVFVEDTEKGTEKLYSILFQRAFDKKYKISRVYPLGGKNEVIKCWRNRPKNTTRMELYVIDSDFSLASFEKSRDPYNNSGKNLLYTSRFCIENYLITEIAAISFLDKKDPSKSRDDIKKQLNYKQWKAMIIPPLQKLFFHLYTARAISEDIPVMKWTYNDITKNKYGEIDSEKVEKICLELKAMSLKFVTKKYWNATFTEIKSEILAKFSNGIEYYVCGKRYLLGLLTLRMKTVTNYKDYSVLQKQSMARNTSLELLRTEIGNTIVIGHRVIF